ncbi:hypothetical protein HYR69_00795 [Candidatus Sumerlaeota bacterium]|nr:hypothetical protein [Candidatus Sumerlaeota bacterium]
MAVIVALFLITIFHSQSPINQLCPQPGVVAKDSLAMEFADDLRVGLWMERVRKKPMLTAHRFPATMPKMMVEFTSLVSSC